MKKLQKLTTREMTKKLRGQKAYLENDCTGINCTSPADFRDVDMRQYNYDVYCDNYKDADLRGACFSGLNLSGYSFAFADLRGADFSDCILIGANFYGAMIDKYTNFAGADLEDAYFDVEY